MLFNFAAICAFGVLAVAQNCGPSYNNQVCAANNCCSQYGWCDTDAAHCDPATCLSQYSGQGSSCAALASSASTFSTSKKTSSTSKKSTSTTSNKTSTTTKKPSTSKTTKKSTATTTATPTPGPYASSVPNIDVCGAASNNISCPGAGFEGQTGYFYRCCSTHGHCGPKNDIQDQDLYCGAENCQAGFGKCDNETAPAHPSGTPGIAQEGDTCGPIVNMVCDTGLCCSGSNYCGTGDDFCGSANWCQADYGECSGQP